MRITVDALPLLGHMGISVYLKSLFPLLAEIGHEHRYNLSFRSMFSKLPDAGSFGANVSRSRICVPNRILEYLWTRHSLSIPGAEIGFGNPDVYFATMYFAPVFNKCRIVPVLFDTTPLEVDEYSGEAREFFQQHAGNIVKRAAHSIAISESAKNDFCRRFGCDPASITVTPLASPPGFVPCGKAGKVKDVLARYGLAGKYILYVGNFVPHKNIPRLIRVFAALKRRRAIEHKLVICGKTTWAKPAIESIRKEGMEGEIVIPGFIRDEDLPVIYSGADMFTFVSLYEGFGLPIIEAMSCGVPVIVSNTSSMPEVVGPAGILVNPLDEASISRAIETIANDSELRNRLSAAGLERAATFSWRNTAELTLKAFERAVL